MPVIAVASKKGGSGKTTISTNLTDALDLTGERVLLLDADPQRSALAWADNAPDELRPAVVGVTAGLAAPRQVQHWRTLYDWVLIDCPPRHGEVFAAALSVADLVLLPTRPSPLDLTALPASLDELRRAQDARPKLLARAVINGRPARSAYADAAPQVIRATGLEVCAAQIGHRTDFLDAFAGGVGVCRGAPKSKAAAEILALLAEIRALLTPPQIAAPQKSLKPQIRPPKKAPPK